MGLLGSLFGGSKQSSTSNNKSYDFIKNALGGQVETGGQGMGAIADFLGLGGGDGTARAGAGLSNYMNSTGFNSLLETAMRGINTTAASKGLLRSGATGNAYAQKTNELGQQAGQNYLGNLMGLAQLGQGAAGTIVGAGQQSTSKGSSSNGIFKSIPLFSDVRLKRDIKPIGSIGVANGHTVQLYVYRYKLLPMWFVGVMAQEIELVMPEALGPRIFGFMTVDYSKLFGKGNN
jgi:hypothetical protein